MASAAECLKALSAAADGHIDDDLLEELLEDLNSVRTSRAAQDGLHTTEQAMFNRADEIVEDAKLAAAIEKRNRYINIIKRAELIRLAKRADAARGDPSLGLEAATVGVNSPFEGGRSSVDAQAQGMRNAALGGIVAELRRENLLAVFNSKALEREISRELWDISLQKPLGNVTTSAQAKQIARIIHKQRRALVQQENRAGAFIRFKQGYVTRQSHNRVRMSRAGEKAWAGFLRERLDWDAMNVPPAKRGAFLKSAYGALVTGVRKEVRGGRENDLLFAFKGPGNLAKKASSSRTLLFRSADDWFDYNAEFGMASLTEALVSDIGRAANNIALMNKFGTNPRAMFDKVREDLSRKYRDTSPEKVKRLQRASLDWYMDEVDGTASIPANYGLATVGRAIRAVISAAKLGMATVSAVTDIAFAAAERRYQGRTLLQSMGDSFQAPIQGWTQRQTQEYGDLLGVGINGAVGTTLERFSAQDDTPGRISKAMGLFFKLNLLTPWTDGVQRGIGAMMSRDLARNADKTLGALPAETQRMLGQYGIDERKWNVARQALGTAEDGTVFLLPGEVDNVSGAVFTGMTRRQQQALKDDVRVAIAAMINERVMFASPTPGGRERALTTAGVQPGTPSGEAIRFLMQFKSFPITVISKVQGREMYGSGARSLHDALLRGEGDLLGLAATIAQGTVLGFAALQAKELLKGREARTDLGPELFIASMLQGGGLGIYGDFLLGESSRFGSSPIETLAGPGLGVFSDTVEIGQGLLHGSLRGEPPDSWAKTLKLIQSNIPGANLLYTKTALDYLVFFQLQEWANPGYLRRVERRMARENNQSFIIPPSRVIPHGAGGQPISFEGVRG